MNIINAQTIIDACAKLALDAPAEQTKPGAPGPARLVRIQVSDKGFHLVVNTIDGLKRYAEKVRKNASAFGGGLRKIEQAPRRESYSTAALAALKSAAENSDGDGAYCASQKLAPIFSWRDGGPCMFVAPCAINFVELPGEQFASAWAVEAAQWIVLHVRSGSVMTGVSGKSRASAELLAARAVANRIDHAASLAALAAMPGIDAHAAKLRWIEQRCLSMLDQDEQAAALACSVAKMLAAQDEVKNEPESITATVVHKGLPSSAADSCPPVVASAGGVVASAQTAAREDGFKAGKRGDRRMPPDTLSVTGKQVWRAGWDAAQKTGKPTPQVPTTPARNSKNEPAGFYTAKAAMADSEPRRAKWAQHPSNWPGMVNGSGHFHHDAGCAWVFKRYTELRRLLPECSTDTARAVTLRELKKTRRDLVQLYRLQCARDASRAATAKVSALVAVSAAHTSSHRAYRAKQAPCSAASAAGHTDATNWAADATGSPGVAQSVNCSVGAVAQLAGRVVASAHRQGAGPCSDAIGQHTSKPQAPPSPTSTPEVSYLGRFPQGVAPGAYKSTQIDGAKDAADFLLMQVCPNVIRWRRDLGGHLQTVTERELKRLQALHPSWQTDF